LGFAQAVWVCARERGFRQGHDSTGREREGRRGIDGGERRMCLRGKKETRLRKSGKSVRDVATETKCTKKYCFNIPHPNKGIA